MKDVGSSNVSGVTSMDVSLVLSAPRRVPVTNEEVDANDTVTLTRVRSAWLNWANAHAACVALNAHDTLIAEALTRRM
jgi:hypothetical protein